MESLGKELSYNCNSFQKVKISHEVGCGIMVQYGANIRSKRSVWTKYIFFSNSNFIIFLNCLPSPKYVFPTSSAEPEAYFSPVCPPMHLLAVPNHIAPKELHLLCTICILNVAVTKLKKTDRVSSWSKSLLITCFHLCFILGQI